MRAGASSKDLYVALGATLLGGLLLFLALRARWNPEDMLPGVEGCLTAGVLATILLLLHPLPYARAMLLSAPVLAIEYWACVVSGGPAVGIVGLHLIIVGFIGLAVITRGPNAAPAEAPGKGRDDAPQRT